MRATAWATALRSLLTHRPTAGGSFFVLASPRTITASPVQSKGRRLDRCEIQGPADTTLAVPDWWPRPLSMLTHVASRDARIGEVLKLRLASGACPVAPSPLVHERLTAYEHGLFGPRSKLGCRHQATGRVLGDITKADAVVMNRSNLKLIRRSIAADRENRERGSTDAAGNGRLKGLQWHSIEASIVRASANSQGPSEVLASTRCRRHRSAEKESVGTVTSSAQVRFDDRSHA